MSRYFTYFAFFIAVGFIIPLEIARSEKTSMLELINEEISGIVDGVRPSIVVVEADFPYRGQDGSRFTVTGTGIVVDENYIVTPASLTEGKSRIRIITDENRAIEVKLAGIDRFRGITILKSPDEKLTPVKPGRISELKIGNYLVILGNTADIPMASVVGTFNGFDNIEKRLKILVNLSLGFSGGAVLNTSGELMGMLIGKNPEYISFISPSGIRVAAGRSRAATQDVYSKKSDDSYFRRQLATGAVSARSVDDIIAAVNQLKEHGKITYGFLGISPRDVGRWRRGKSTTKMVQVINVTNNSPASYAGIKDGDYIISYNNEKIIDTGRLHYLVKTTLPGDTVEITLVHLDSLKSIKVEIGEVEPSLVSRVPVVPGVDFPVPKLFPQPDFSRVKAQLKELNRRENLFRRVEQLTTQMHKIQAEIQQINIEIREDSEEDKR